MICTKDNMKIAQIIATFPPYHGGMGYICYHNTRVLAERGHDVTVFTLDHRRMTYENDPETFRIVRLKTPVLYGDAGMVPQLFNRIDGFDIVHLHYPFFGGAEYVYLAAALKNKPYFLTYHMDVFGAALLKKAILSGYEPLFLKRIVQKAALICAPGPEYLKSTKAGPYVPWHKLTDVVYGGVNTAQFKPRPKNSALVAKHNLQEKKIALFVGNLIPFKGLHLIIEALDRIRNPDFVLLVVGGGYHSAYYHELVRKKHLEDRVVFAGPQSPEGALPDYYNLADFFVLPSTHSESFGLVILEAMASGKPVVVSALPGPSSLVQDGETGFIVRIGDVADLEKKMRRLYESDLLCDSLGQTARKSVELYYQWSRIGQQLESCYHSIL